MDPIVITVTREPKDLVVWMAFVHRNRRRFFLVMGTVLAGFGLVGFALLDPDSITKQSLSICVGMGLMFLFMAWTQKGGFKKAARLTLKDARPEKWVLAPAGIHAETTDTRVDMEWSRFKSVRRLPGVYVLVEKPGLGFVLPERSFDSEHYVNQFLSWAAQAGLRIE